MIPESQEKSFLVKTPMCVFAGRETARLRKQREGFSASQCRKAIMLLMIEVEIQSNRGLYWKDSLARVSHEIKGTDFY